MKWTIDPDHSSAAFAIRHLMLANVRGLFNKIIGTIQFDAADPDRASVDVSIEVRSLTTGIGKRDEHLLSGDFFDVAKYPEITFKSTGIEMGDGTKGRISGELTIHGVTRPVTLDAEYYGPVKSPVELGGETTMGFSATTVIDRRDFGVLWNVPLDDGGIMVGNDVHIALDIEADLAEES